MPPLLITKTFGPSLLKAPSYSGSAKRKPYTLQPTANHLASLSITLFYAFYAYQQEPCAGGANQQELHALTADQQVFQASMTIIKSMIFVPSSSPSFRYKHVLNR
jgi:hypothetical protein